MREWTDCVVDFGSLAAEAAERITPGAAQACRQKPREFFSPLSFCVARTENVPGAPSQEAVTMRCNHRVSFYNVTFFL